MLSAITCGLWAPRAKPEIVISQPIMDEPRRFSFRPSRRVPPKPGVPRIDTPEPRAPKRMKLDVPEALRPSSMPSSDYEAWITEQLDSSLQSEARDAKRLSAKAKGKRPERRPILYKAQSSEGRVHFHEDSSIKATESNSSSSKYSSRYA